MQCCMNVASSKNNHIEIKISDQILPSAFVIPIFNKNIEWSNPTENEMDISGFEIEKYCEFLNIVCVLKVFKDSFPIEDLDYMPNVLNNKNNNLLRCIKHHGKKSILNKLNITQKISWKYRMENPIKKA